MPSCRLDIEQHHKCAHAVAPVQDQEVKSAAPRGARETPPTSLLAARTTCLNSANPHTGGRSCSYFHPAGDYHCTVPPAANGAPPTTGWLAGGGESPCYTWGVLRLLFLRVGVVALILKSRALIVRAERSHKHVGRRMLSQSYRVLHLYQDSETHIHRFVELSLFQLLCMYKYICSHRA